MGKIITPKYRVRYRDQKGWHVQAWTGRATNARAEAWRKSWNESFQANGVNAHLAKSYGFVPHISHVRVERNIPGGHTVATATMPMFEVV